MLKEKTDLVPAHDLPRVASRQHVGWWIVTGVVVLAGLGIVKIALTSPALQWDVVASYLTVPRIISGLGRTLLLTLVAESVGVALGTILAVMRLSPVKILSGASWGYIWVFRGTPLLVQIIFWYNIGALIPSITMGLPGGGELFSINTNDLITPFTAAVLALSLNEGAYMAEIVRAGIQSVDSGQREAAAALGMRRATTMWRIVLPQAMRVIIPPTGNQTIGMLKSTALVSVTSLPELLYSAQLIYSKTFETIPLLVVASIWYLAITTVLTIGQYYLERYFARGNNRALPPTPLQRIRASLSRVGGSGRQAGAKA